MNPHSHAEVRIDCAVCDAQEAWRTAVSKRDAAVLAAYANGDLVEREKVEALAAELALVAGVCIDIIHDSGEYPNQGGCPACRLASLVAALDNMGGGVKP
jgi:hypothetical protein